MYRVEREYDGFKADIGETLTYLQVIKWTHEFGLQNTADYYAKIRVFKDGEPFETYDFPPGAHTDYKGD